MPLHLELKDIVEILALMISVTAMIITTRQNVANLTQKFDSLTAQVEKLAEKTEDYAITSVQVGNLKERIFTYSEAVNLMNREMMDLKSAVTLLKSGGSDHLNAALNQFSAVQNELTELKGKLEILKMSGCDICRHWVSLDPRLPHSNEKA